MIKTFTSHETVFYRQVASPDLGLDPGYFSAPQVIEFPTTGPDGEPSARTAFLNYCE